MELDGRAGVLRDHGSHLRDGTPAANRDGGRDLAGAGVPLVAHGPASRDRAARVSPSLSHLAARSVLRGGDDGFPHPGEGGAPAAPPRPPPRLPRGGGASPTRGTRPSPPRRAAPRPV